jgi:hypothetical protein
METLCITQISSSNFNTDGEIFVLEVHQQAANWIDLNPRKILIYYDVAFRNSLYSVYNKRTYITSLKFYVILFRTNFGFFQLFPRNRWKFTVNFAVIKAPLCTIRPVAFLNRAKSSRIIQSSIEFRDFLKEDERNQEIENGWRGQNGETVWRMNKEGQIVVNNRLI